MLSFMKISNSNIDLLISIVEVLKKVKLSILGLIFTCYLPVQSFPEVKLPTFDKTAVVLVHKMLIQLTTLECFL